MAKTANERKSADRKRKREAGLVPVEVWIPEAKKSELKRMIGEMIK